MRQKAKNDFEKDFFKLMNNSVFGKTIQNVRKERRMKVVNDWNGKAGAAVLTAKPHFKDHIILDEDTALIELYKTKVCLNKPIYVGATVLDLSKHLMYDFHYNFVKKVMPRTRLMYTDTDSFIYHFKGDSLTDLMKINTDLFDTSSYPPTHEMYSPKNKAVIGKMKDEVNGRQIRRFVGLRAKMYAIDVEGDVKKKAKGIRNTVLRHFTFGDYCYYLYGGKEEKIQQRHFKSQAHDMYTTLVTKIGLSARDDKRYVLPEDPTQSLPWGPKTQALVNAKTGEEFEPMDES